MDRESHETAGQVLVIGGSVLPGGYVYFPILWCLSVVYFRCDSRTNKQIMYDLIHAQAADLHEFA